MNCFETTQVTWDEQSERFFHLTADLFPTAFSYGAGVLLATYDPDDAADTVTVAPAVPEQSHKRTRLLTLRF
ncbi:MAG: hypothetical protein JO246_18000 [Frankiaceae bacterium]|nr:hypothetical protein [Frankiaceae bacterium]MBV9872822.1 hypothetical protein [Frankiaceae bacterium]